MTTAHHRPHALLVSVLAASAIALTACSSSGTTAGVSATGAPASTSPASSTSSQILPVTSNPITNSATAKTLTIASVLVENNVDPTDGKPTDDHLEVALKNTGTTTLSGVEIFYTIKDPTASTSESYYTKLPTTFAIPAGQTRIAHFDNTGAVDHFAVNKYSLYYTSKNPLEVTVVASATGAAVQTASVKKDAGGPEQAD